MKVAETTLNEGDTNLSKQYEMTPKSEKAVPRDGLSFVCA